jgi:hypothetical protein
VTPRGLIIAERFIRGAPITASLLYAKEGLSGLVALLAPLPAGLGPAHEGSGTGAE